MKPHGYVETFVIDHVKDAHLPETVPGFEALRPMVSELLANCPVLLTRTIDDHPQAELPFDSPDPYSDITESELELRQPTYKHIRSFMVDAPEFNQTWQDEYNNTYRAITLKGNNFSHSQLIETATAQDRFIAYGLQESAIIERVLKASELLRSNGIGTEFIVGLAEPKEFLIRDRGLSTGQEAVPLAHYKHYLGEKHWNELPEAEQTPERYVEIARRQERSTYYISARAMDTPYRLGDIANDPEARSQFFELLNTELRKDDEPLYDPNSTEDFNRYAETYFIPSLVKNMVTLHELGLAHTYPNNMNLSAFGSLVDLDSMRGEPLGFGEPPLTTEQIAIDIVEVIQGLSGLGNLDPSKPSIENHIDGMALANSFVRQYIEQACPSMDEEAKIRHLYEVIEQAQKLNQETPGHHDFPDSLAWVRLQQQLGEYIWDNPETIGAVVHNWLHNNQEDLSEQVDKIITTNLGMICQTLIEDCVRSQPKEFANGELDPFAILMGRTEELVESGAYLTLAFSVVRDKLLKPRFQQYTAETLDARFSSKAEALKANFSAEELKEMAFAVFDIPQAERAVDDWANGTVYKKLEDYADAIREQSKPVIELHVLLDRESNPLLTDFDGRIISETHSVPLTVVINEILAQPGADFNIELVKDALSYRGVTYVASGYDVNDGAELVQIVTDRPQSDVLPDYTLREEMFHLSGVDYALKDGEYILFVEQKTDGTYRYELHLADRNLKINASSPQEALQRVRQRYWQPRLFTVEGVDRMPFIATAAV